MVLELFMILKVVWRQNYLLLSTMEIGFGGLLGLKLWRIFKLSLLTASRKGVYVGSNTLEALRETRDQIGWWKIVWFSLAPKQAFILWLAMKDRLMTGVRLLSCGYK
jgi:hypothetical protein